MLLVRPLCLLVLIAQARKTINRKRFLGEHERTAYSFVPDGAKAVTRDQ